MSTPRLIGIALLALAAVFLALAGWRGYVHYAAAPEDYLLVRWLGPAVTELPEAKQAEYREKILARGRRAEGVIATGCLIGAVVLTVAGYRRLRPASAPKASSATV